MLSFTLNSTTVTAKLSALSAALKDFSEPLNAAGEDLLEYFSTQIFGDQGLDEEVWSPWALRTAMARQRRKGYYALPPEREDQILVWTGKMHNSFFTQVDIKTLIIANSDPKFVWHQLGTGKMPKRQMLKINAHVVTTVSRAIYEYITPIWSR